MDEIQKDDYSMKGLEQYFPLVLIIMLYKKVLTSNSVDEMLKYSDHSNEGYRMYILYNQDPEKQEDRYCR